MIVRRPFRLKSFFRGVARLLALCMVVSLWSASAFGGDEPLPVKVPDLLPKDAGIRNQVTYDQINNVIGPDAEGKGLVIDLEDPTLMGTVYTGPYPFEAGQADMDYFRFRKSSSVVNGTGTLRISDFFKEKYNANNWPDGQGWEMTPTIGYRLDLWSLDGADIEHLGFYNSVASFANTGDTYTPVTTILQGPFLSMVNSDDPTSVVITWGTDCSCWGSVTVASDKGMNEFFTVDESHEGVEHAVKVTGLRPDAKYFYFVSCETSGAGQTVSNRYEFRTAPKPGKGTVRIAFVGDSREGVGAGERTYMGVNFKILNWIAQDAYRKNADLMIFGGDLVNGYTTDTEDFKLQLTGWKQAVSGFWRSHPVYPGMGNHETLLNTFDDGSNYGLSLDKWPYETSSAETVFADMFYNPENGPEPSDSRRPTYRENVYSFQYGPVLIISFNNNYWWTSNGQVPAYGGSPEGYIMPDQLEWIEQELEKAENNRTVKYVLLYAQEPVWPCGGHVKDAMWWNGNNNIKAYSLNEVTGEVEPAGPGIIEVRNRFWKAVSTSSKVAAVLGADEHEYYRLLIDDNTPVGLPEDDTNGDGVLDQYSPNPEFVNPVYFVTSGTGGAPYYSREDTPWEPDVLTSQHGYTLIEADSHQISLKFITATGQVFDRIDDLMAVKKRHRRRPWKKLRLRKTLD